MTSIDTIQYKEKEMELKSINKMIYGEHDDVVVTGILMTHVQVMTRI